ncbi:MAG TPA: hypothetical protein VF614_15060 [Chthoniobacteraceae bacterium]|jgi:hypothetical protein
MTTPFRSLLAVAALLISGVAASATGNESLYNPKAAQKLDTSKLSIFGPQAGKFRYDKRMIKAAEIAADRARKKSTSRCWRYVKTALLASRTIDSYPKTAYAKQAAVELQKSYGFKRIKVTDPYKAPLGSVLVYGGRGAGHVEIRTAQGFVSDFQTPKASPRPLIGVFVKPPA